MKRKIINFGIAILLGAQLLCPTSGYAENYYVHANVGDNRNSGLEPNDAFATLRYAMWQLHPGDTLFIRSGFYDESVTLSSDNNNSGTSTQPIVVKPYQNEKPVISNSTIKFLDMSWWLLEDLVFESRIVLGDFEPSLPAGNQCIAISENIMILRSIFQHGSYVGVRVNCGRNIKIENNIFDNVRSRIEGKDINAVALAHYANNISISGNRFTDIGAAGVHILDGSQFTDVNIINNEFEVIRPYRYRDENGYIIPEDERPFDNVGETGITIKQGPGPILISNNRFHGFRPSLVKQDASGAIGSGIDISTMANGITVAKNHFYNNSLHINAGVGTKNSTDNLDVDLQINHNIFEDAADESNNGSTARGLYLHKVNNIKVLNNTFINPAGHEGSVLHLYNVFNLYLKNNVFYNGKVSVGNISLVADYNTWPGITGELDPTMVGPNDVVTNDPLINLSTWAPLDGSPLIDKGTNAGTIEDFNGSPLLGLGPDIGAVEYRGTIQPGGVEVDSQALAESDSSGGGCTINTSARMDPIWLFLLLLPAAGFARQRLR